MKSRTKYILALLLLVLAVANGWFIYSLLRLSDLAENLHRNAWLLHDTEQAFSLLRDAESGQRGYLITNRKEYLEPYVEATKHIEEVLLRITEEDGDNPELVKEFSRLTGLKMAELQYVITVHDSRGEVAAQKEVFTHLGKNLMNRAGEVVHKLEVLQQQKVNEGMRQFRRTLTSIEALLIFNVIASFMLCTLSVRLYTDKAEKLEQVVDWVHRELHVRLPSV